MIKIKTSSSRSKTPRIQISTPSTNNDNIQQSLNLSINNNKINIKRRASISESHSHKTNQTSGIMSISTSNYVMKRRSSIQDHPLSTPTSPKNSIEMNHNSPLTQSLIINRDRRSSHSERSSSVGVTSRRMSISTIVPMVKIDDEMLQLFEECKTPDEYVDACKIGNIFFFADPKVFQITDKEYIKLSIWEMEENYRILFKKIIDSMDDCSDRSRLCEIMLPQSTIKYPVTFIQYLHELFEWKEYIFNREIGNVKYDETGEIMEMTTECHWNFAIDIQSVSLSQFVIECVPYMKDDEFLSKLIEIIEETDSNFKRSEDQRKMRLLRLQRLTTTWVKLMIENIQSNPQLIEKLFTSIIFSGSLFSQNILKNIRRDIQTKKEDEITQSLQSPPTIKKFSTVIEVDKEYRKKGSKKTKIYQIKSLVVAQQLILFDQKLWNRVHFNEFFSVKDFKTLDLYTKRIQFVEQWTKQSLAKYSSSKILSFFIKLSYHCKELGDFNVSCLIYTILSTYCCDIRNKKVVNDIKSKSKKKFKELEELFSISMQHAKYKMEYTNHNEPKIPVVALLLGENIRSDTLETFSEENTLNMLKIRKIAKVVDTLYNAKEISFVFREINEIQTYFEELVKFFVK